MCSRIANISDLVKIEVGGEYFVFVAGGLGDDLSARIDKVARSVKLANVPGQLGPDAFDAGDEVSVGCAVSRLNELLEIFAEAGDGCRGIEDDFGAIQSQAARSLGEVAVVTDVHPDLCEPEIKDRIAEIAGTEVELFPKAGRDVRNVRLAIFAEIGPSFWMTAAEL